MSVKNIKIEKSGVVSSVPENAVETYLRKGFKRVDGKYAADSVEGLKIQVTDLNKQVADLQKALDKANAKIAELTAK